MRSPVSVCARRRRRRLSRYHGKDRIENRPSTIRLSGTGRTDSDADMEGAEFGGVPVVLELAGGGSVDRDARAAVAALQFRITGEHQLVGAHAPALQAVEEA